MSEYWARVRELSDDFARKKKAVDEFWSKHPTFEEEGTLQTYRELQNAARSAAMRWTEYCTKNME